MSKGELFNLEMERATIGAMLQDPACIEAAATIVDPLDFSKTHAPIFATILLIWQDGGNPDVITVAEALERADQLEAIGGKLYLNTELATTGATGANVRAYAEKVKSLSIARQAITAMRTAATKISQNGGDPRETIGSVIEKLQAIHEPESESRQHGYLTNRIREYIAGCDGVFHTYQLCADLGITDPKEKSTVRAILSRMRGEEIQSYGNHAGCFRAIRGELEAMDLQNSRDDELDLWLPFDLHNYATIMPGNIIIVTGDPDSGKTAFLLRTIRENLNKWSCYYFNSEMGGLELRKRLDLFPDFPIEHPNFHAFERSDAFEDVIKPGKHVLNVVDYLELSQDFFLVSRHLNEIYKCLHEAIALVAIQKRDRNSDLPLGGGRSLEKPRLAVALSAGNRNTPNRATILKCKNRKTTESMIGKSRIYKLIKGCEFRPESPVWA